MAAGKSDGGKVLWMVVWFLVLLFLAFPIAGFCAGFYILFVPFTVCIEGLKVKTDSFNVIKVTNRG